MTALPSFSEYIPQYILAENLGKLEGFEQLVLSLDVQASQTTLLKILAKFSSKSNAVYARAMLVEERIYKCHES